MEQNKNIYLTQVLVHNFLFSENESSNINIYGEFIDGIDIFTTKLKINETLNTKFKSSKPCDEDVQTIDVFLSITNDINEVIFEDFLKLLSKMKYPMNVSVQIIYVSLDTSNYNTLSMSSFIDTFNEYKTRLLSLNKIDLHLVVNNLINDPTYKKLTINDAFIKVFNKLKSKKLTVEYNVTNEFINIFKNNLKKCTIRELLLKDLIDKPMKPEILKEEYDFYL